MTPHVAVDGHLRVSGRPRATAIDRRTARDGGYAVSQRMGKRIDERCDWGKSAAGLAKVKL